MEKTTRMKSLKGERKWLGYVKKEKEKVATFAYWKFRMKMKGL